MRKQEKMQSVEPIVNRRQKAAAEPKLSEIKHKAAAELKDTAKKIKAVEPIKSLRKKTASVEAKKSPVRSRAVAEAKGTIKAVKAVAASKPAKRKASTKKAESSIKFEEFDKAYNRFIRESKNKIAYSKKQLEMLQGKIENLEQLLSLGKVITIHAYKAQKKKIVHALGDIEVSIKKNPAFIKSQNLPIESLEAMKSALHAISERIEPASKKIIKSIDSRKEAAEKTLASIKDKIKKRIDYDHRRDVFQDELAIAYKHLKKAFVLA